MATGLVAARLKRATFKDEPGALVFAGVTAGPVRRGNFNKLSGWPHAVEALGMPGLHFHDLFDKHVDNERGQDDGEGDDGAAGVPVPA